jgi:hypothetical protein
VEVACIVTFYTETTLQVNKNDPTGELFFQKMIKDGKKGTQYL